MRDFTVKKGVQGYVVMIGCQVAGFSTAADLLVSIGEYVNDPEGTEKKYYTVSAPLAQAAMHQWTTDSLTPVGTIVGGSVGLRGQQ